MVGGECCYHGSDKLPPFPCGAKLRCNYFTLRHGGELNCHEKEDYIPKTYRMVTQKSPVPRHILPSLKDHRPSVLRGQPFSGIKSLQLLTKLCLMVLLLSPLIAAEYFQEFEVSESVPVGTKIGFVGDVNAGQSPPRPPYLVVPVPSSSGVDIKIDEDSGEIRTKAPLDREVRASYSFVAIPQVGENIKVIINIKDENDNAPQFPEPTMYMLFPENTPRDVKKTLTPAIDKDLGLFNTQRYVIVSGNINNAFRLSSHRGDDGVLYLDLQVNGFLDRETTEFYSLVIEAWDEGNPPLKGSMVVNITIQDTNDNQPIFNQSRYFATIPENATIGTSVLQVLATDTDAGDNGKVTYSINRRQSDRDYMFQIEPKTGIISVNRPLDFEIKGIHELVVVAKDNVEQPHETTAFVSIRIIDVNDNQPTINLIFLSDDVTPKISEDAQPGEYVARISVNDPDSKGEHYANVNVSLEGSTGHFGLDTQDSTIYLMVVSKPLDREEQSNFTLVVVASDQGNPPLHASREFNLQITDVNDNSPEFDKTIYHANVPEVADPGTSVFQLSALDMDDGENSVVSYSIRDSPESHSNWFQIDSSNGLITTRTYIDCETDPQPEITVIATDAGFPSQSSSTTVKVTIMDVNDNEPIFDQSFYNVSVQESETENTCILKVSATDPDCGVNAMVNYTFGGPSRGFNEFEIRPTSGDICISGRLDYERRPSYEFPVVATDRGGLSTTAMVKIQVTDANDNKPSFYPTLYNVSLVEPHASHAPVVVLAATDKDSGIYGRVIYELLSGNDGGLFRLDEKTGKLFVTSPLRKAQSLHVLKFSARDGAGLRSTENAIVSISINDANQEPPIFEQPRYTFSASENLPVGTSVGTVVASSRAQDEGEIQYSISSGDPNGYLKVDSRRGVVRTAKPLDHEDRPFVLLNVLATYGDPPSYGHCQVNITVVDVNDNTPQFEVGEVRISVPEDVQMNEAIYVAHADDADSGDNGQIRYRLIRNPGNVFVVDENGVLKLRRELDFESLQRFSLLLEASDQGDPPLASNLSITLEVQDVNDNPPVFEKRQYYVAVPESLKMNAEFLQVSAHDRDTGNNARLTYSMKEGEFDGLFGVFPNSGTLYLKKLLDRETRDRFLVTVVATDNGIPVSTASTTVSIAVLDVNDNAPQFSQEVYEFTVEENVPAGTPVGVVKASDADLGDNASLAFSITAAQESFTIDSLTGNIVTRVALDREHRAIYEVIVEVRDGGLPQQSSKTTVRVLITDVNDHSPVFIEPPEGAVGVREDLTVGSEVLVVKATDQDEGNNASITYSLIQGDDGNSFVINATSGSVITRTVLDYGSKYVYDLLVEASDNGSPVRSTKRKLRLVALDSVEVLPSPSSSLNFEIREGVPVGSTVGYVSLESNGGLSSPRIIYKILSGNDRQIFDINRETGHLFVVKEVDYEEFTEFSLKIQATDLFSLSPKTSLSVQIVVKDVNDEIPAFKNDPIRFSIMENLNVGENVWNFTAIDLDSGNNGQIKYSLIQQSPKSVFRLDPITGALFLISPLDSEEISEFYIVVTATDQPTTGLSLRSSVTARIIVLDHNDNAPTFMTASRIEVLENEPVNFPILHVRATDEDRDSNGQVSYSLVSGNKEKHFAIDEETGLLSIAKALDRETGNHFVLGVVASDLGQPRKSASQTIEVFILDVNDNPPKFSSNVYKTNISEASPPGTFVAKVSALDKDLGIYGNLTYLIPAGISSNKFRINSTTGEIKTISTLDREMQDEYILTVYVKDGGAIPLYDSASVLVSLTDANDHTPEFRDSCYPLRVPENTDLSVMHTVLATDPDVGVNGEITYSIINGDIDRKFNIDSYTGLLSSKPMDRESRSKYHLVIAAEDRGSPPLRGYCNLTISVEDQNDNDPEFAKSSYMVTIPENTPLGTTIVLVEANDRDTGDNARLTYSLTNETQWLFAIHNDSGAIFTTGFLDREKRNSYTFEVRATDNGKYDARTREAQIHIVISDINDNRPEFEDCPMLAEVPVYLQPRREVARVVAADKDEGLNGQILYSLGTGNSDERFRIDPDKGIVSSVRQLSSDGGRIFHLEVIASDRGAPTQSSTCLVRIHVGDTSSTPSIRFTNQSYTVTLKDSSHQGKVVTQVTAISSNNHRRPIIYNIRSGNDYDYFDVDRQTGLVSIKHPPKPSLESSPLELILWLEAHSEGTPEVVAYTLLRVTLMGGTNVARAPKFTQEQYVSSVWEGNFKGAYVMQISATDSEDMRIVYDIIDGNHDNAFVISPPHSGIVKTNIVLDREIRDAYQLTIIASDESGRTQVTGTCTLRINIVDVNDNLPTFPPHSVVEVSEGAEVGTLVTTITANDVDTNPALTYSFSSDGNPGDAFSIDRFSGKIILARPLDFEMVEQFTLKVEASDSSHVAHTSITIQVVDENDNAPVFSQHDYHVDLPELSALGTSLLQFSATDDDSESNAAITYHLASQESQFYVNRETGVLHTNSTIRFDPDFPVIQLVVEARDGGTPSLATFASVRVHVVDVNDHSPVFERRMYDTQVSEDAPVGHVVIKVSATDGDESSANGDVFYSIVDSDLYGVFHISKASGEISLIRPIDRELVSSYELAVVAHDRGFPFPRNSTCKVTISLLDVNDNAPVFNQTEYRVEVSEALETGRAVLQVAANDRDVGLNAQVNYELTSGNEMEMFSLDAETGIISLREPLDYDTVSSYRFVVRAVDNNKRNPLSSLAVVYLNVLDENDNDPHFPVERYLEFIPENSPVGSTVFTVHASDSDRGDFGRLQYSINSGEDRSKFDIESVTGVVTTRVTFDYEIRQGYYFVVKVVDAGGKTATVDVQVNVESRDEFAPVFSKSDYFFAVASDVPIGSTIGRVSASDKDDGQDGRVIYVARSPSSFFEMNRNTGHIVIKKLPTKNQGFKFEVEANSGLVGSLKSVTIVKLSFGGENTTWDDDLLFSADGHDSSSGLAGWAVTLLVALVLLLIVFGVALFFLYRRNFNVRKPKISDQFDTSFDTIATSPPGDISQYPPRYNDIRHFSHHATRPHHHHGNTATSELSEKSQSTSSGRGSADDNDDVEDEEIRMINEAGGRIPSKEHKGHHETSISSSPGVQEDDNISDVSVHNTQEYLARLGIDTSKNESLKGSQGDMRHPNISQSGSSVNLFERQNPNEPGGVDLSSLLYSKVTTGVPFHADDASLLDGAGRGFGFGDETHPSMTGSLSSIVHSEEELQGSYNWDYLLDWGPQYQPLAHVFSEIARLKDDSASGHPQQKALFPPPKKDPPPLLTSVAPRSIAPVALTSPRNIHLTLHPSMARSPLSHESSFNSPAALSPSFSPALSPLAATRSPSISPLVGPPCPVNRSRGLPSSQGSVSSSTSHRNWSRGHLIGSRRQSSSGMMSVTCSSSESELRI